MSKLAFLLILSNVIPDKSCLDIITLNQNPVLNLSSFLNKKTTKPTTRPAKTQISLYIPQYGKGSRLPPSPHHPFG